VRGWSCLQPSCFRRASGSGTSSAESLPPATDRGSVFGVCSGCNLRFSGATRKRRATSLEHLPSADASACPTSTRPTPLPPCPAAPNAGARCGTIERGSAIRRRPTSSARTGGATASSGHRVERSPALRNRRRLAQRALRSEPPRAPLRRRRGSRALASPRRPPARKWTRTACPSVPSAAVRCGTTAPPSAIRERRISSAATSRASAGAPDARASSGRRATALRVRTHHPHLGEAPRSARRHRMARRPRARPRGTGRRWTTTTCLSEWVSW